ncbi:hypothetical protein, partial [Acetobacter sp. P1H12_c]|uniref:hypothetical protein n=1 Tax=Acetobacter sp. P1H12_c TaxID=2762621 RepID=UPI001C0410D9
MPPRSRGPRPATGLSYAAILFLLALTLPARSHAASARPDGPQDTLPDQTTQRMVVDLTPAPGVTQRILVLRMRWVTPGAGVRSTTMRCVHALC